MIKRLRGQAVTAAVTPPRRIDFRAGAELVFDRGEPLWDALHFRPSGQWRA